jgi:hypothetical protein
MPETSCNPEAGTCTNCRPSPPRRRSQARFCRIRSTAARCCRVPAAWQSSAASTFLAFRTQLGSRTTLFQTERAIRPRSGTPAASSDSRTFRRPAWSRTIRSAGSSGPPTVGSCRAVWSVATGVRTRAPSPSFELTSSREQVAPKGARLQSRRRERLILDRTRGRGQRERTFRAQSFRRRICDLAVENGKRITGEANAADFAMLPSERNGVFFNSE